jgi:hypothetical protein
LRAEKEKKTMADDGNKRALLGKERLYAGLAETYLTATDAEVLADCADAGEAPRAAADAVRALMHRAAKDHRQRHLRAAAAEYRRLSAAMQTRWVDLPVSPMARRSLLATVLAANPRIETAFLTVQHREFKELSDGDVESCLVQLAELGVLDLGPKEDGGVH